MTWFSEHKKILSGAAILCLVCGIGWGVYEHYANVKKPLVLYGNVDIRQVSLAFNSSERIDEMTKNEGDTVTKGEVLAKLNTRPLELAIERQKAAISAQEAQVEKLHNGSRSEDIASAQAQVNALSATEANARVYYNRMLKLRSTGAISRQTADNAEAQWKSADANLNNAQAVLDKAVNGARKEDVSVAEAQLAELKAQLKTYEYNLSQATLVAPEDGVIRSRLLEPGDMAAPSVPVYMIGITSPKWVRAYVAEDRLGDIHEGMKAKVYTDSDPSHPIEGQVGYISNTAEFTPKTVQTEELRTALVYEVRIYVQDPDNKLRMGMPATVKF